MVIWKLKFANLHGIHIIFGSGRKVESGKCNAMRKELFIVAVALAGTLYAGDPPPTGHRTTARIDKLISSSDIIISDTAKNGVSVKVVDAPASIKAGEEKVIKSDSFVKSIVESRKSGESENIPEMLANPEIQTLLLGYSGGAVAAGIGGGQLASELKAVLDRSREIENITNKFGAITSSSSQVRLVENGRLGQMIILLSQGIQKEFQLGDKQVRLGNGGGVRRNR